MSSDLMVSCPLKSLALLSKAKQLYVLIEVDSIGTEPADFPTANTCCAQGQGRGPRTEEQKSQKKRQDHECKRLKT